MRELKVDIRFFENPVEGDKFSFKLNKNNNNVVYDTTNLITVNKMFTELDKFPLNRFGRFNRNDLNLINTFNDGVNTMLEVTSIAELDSNNILVAGRYLNASSDSRWGVIKASKDGEYLGIFYEIPSTSTNRKINFVKNDNGIIYIGGNIANNRCVIRTDVNGVIDLTYNNIYNITLGGNSEAEDIAFIAEDRHIVVGRFDAVNSINNRDLVCLNNSNGSVNTVFNSVRATDGRIKTIAYDGFKIWIGGTFTTYNGNSYIQRLSLIGVPEDPLVTFPVSTTIEKLLRVDNHLYIGGSFASINTVQRFNLGRMIVGNQSEIDEPTLDIMFATENFLDNDVYDIAFDSIRNEVLVVGRFQAYGTATDVFNFVRIKGNDADFESNLSLNNTANCILLTGNDVFLGGLFTELGQSLSTIYNFISIGSDYTDSADETSGNLNAYNNRSDITHERFIEVINDEDVEIVRMTFTFEDDDIVTVSEITQTDGRVEIFLVNESINLLQLTNGCVLRSPNLIKSTGLNFDTTEFKIWAYKGNYFDYIGADPTYIKTKQKVSPLQDTIYINWSDLAKDRIEADIESYISNTGVSSIGINESKWVRVESQNKLIGVNRERRTDIYLATDGYITPFETQGLPKVLTTGNTKYYHKDSKVNIHFSIKDLTSITLVQDFDVFFFTVPTFTGENTDYIYKLNPNLLGGDSTLTFEFIGAPSQTIVFKTYDECKYPLNDVIFKNKYGVLETLSFSKLSRKSLEVEKSSYNRSIVDLNGNYNPLRHSMKDFNAVGMELITLNTDWIPEYMNPQFEEMFLSEEIWVREGDKVVPVIIEDRTFNTKTKLNEKLINYTVKFKTSHNKINNFA